MNRKTLLDSKDIKVIKSLHEIDGPGKYRMYYDTESPDIITVELSYDIDSDRDMYRLHIGNYTVMQGWQPKKWKTFKGLKQAMLDYAVRGEHHVPGEIR